MRPIFDAGKLRYHDCCCKIGLSVLRANGGLAEQLRETTIFGIFSHVAAGGTFPAFTPEGIVVGF